MLLWCCGVGYCGFTRWPYNVVVVVVELLVIDMLQMLLEHGGHSNMFTSHGHVFLFSIPNAPHPQEAWPLQGTPCYLPKSIMNLQAIHAANMQLTYYCETDATVCNSDFLNIVCNWCATVDSCFTHSTQKKPTNHCLSLAALSLHLLIASTPAWS